MRRERKGGTNTRDSEYGRESGTSSKDERHGKHWKNESESGNWTVQQR